jgi:hypothetical protein
MALKWTAFLLLVGAPLGCVLGDSSDIYDRLEAVEVGDCDGIPIDFTADVLPILEANCALCHGGDNPVSGLLLETNEAYDNIVNVPSNSGAKLYVVESDPDGSFLLDRILGVNDASIMPPGSDGISAEEATVVQCWIEAGALAPAGE